MFYSANQSYHWILNLWDDKIQCPTTNENRVTSFTFASEQYIRWQNLGFLIDHDDVHLREMRQSIYREEKANQTSKDPCRFLTDLFLWGMQQRVQPIWQQQQTWSGPQLQLDLRGMWSVLQQIAHSSSPSCPARETRGQAETTDEENSSTWLRTHPEAATYRVITNKYPSRKRRVAADTEVLPDDPETRVLYLRHWNTIRTEEATSNRVQDRYNFTLHEMTASTFTEMVHRIFREQTTAFKINVSFGFILRHMETGELRYYHSSQNNSRLLDVPHIIRTEEDLEKFLNELQGQDILEYIRQQRPDTKWVVHLLTNLTCYVNKLFDHPIGARGVLHDFFLGNQGLVCLVGGSNGPYTDNLCFSDAWSYIVELQWRT